MTTYYPLLALAANPNVRREVYFLFRIGLLAGTEFCAVVLCVTDGLKALRGATAFALTAQMLTAHTKKRRSSKAFAPH